MYGKGSEIADQSHFLHLFMQLLWGFTTENDKTASPLCILETEQFFLDVKLRNHCFHSLSYWLMDTLLHHGLCYSNAFSEFLILCVLIQNLLGNGYFMDSGESQLVFDERNLAGLNWGFSLSISDFKRCRALILLTIMVFFRRESDLWNKRWLNIYFQDVSLSCYYCDCYMWLKLLNCNCVGI